MSKIKHVAFLNPHGNFDQNDSCYNEHPDFGKQQLYVKNIAQGLAEIGVKVDIITRQINDPQWPQFNKLYDSYPAYDNLRIIRLPFGGNKFLAKEKLWPHLKNYIDAAAEFYDEEGFFPDYFSAHYGLGGLAGVLLKEKIEVPFSFSAHSLAAAEMDHLNFNQNNSEKMIKKYKFHSRLIAERLAMSFANQIIVDRAQENIEDYSHPYYQNTAELSNQAKFSLISTEINNPDSDFKKKSQPSLLQEEQKNKSCWQKAARAYLQAMVKSVDYEIPVDHSKIPAYFFLPDSDNEHKLLEKFNKKVFKK